ncbi:restriction endonuclease subunit S [Pirellulaceae bacterium SH449]
MKSEKSKVESVVRLAEVAELNPRISADISPDSLVSFVPMAAVSEESASVISEETRVAKTCVKGFTPFKRNDVLVAKITPCFENGKIVIANIEHEFGFGSTEFHVIRPKKGVLDERYLLHCLRQPYVRTQGQRRMTGSAGQRRVPAQFLSTFALPLPPFKAQRRIAEILDRAEALRAKRRAALALLDELTQSIFLDMFGDPVSNPKGWEIKKFSELGTLDRGVSKNRPRNSPHLLGGIHPLIQTGDIANSGGYIRKHVSKYSDAGLKQSKMWPAGTLCMTIAANIAKTGILTFDACFPDSVVGFKSDPATVEYSRVWLSFLQKTLEDAAPESAQKNINLATLRNLPVPTPPLNLQTDFASRINAAEELKRVERAS